jgi:hypothetical protein
MSAQKNMTKEERYQLAQSFTMMLEFGVQEAPVKKSKKSKAVKAASVKAEDTKEV